MSLSERYGRARVGRRHVALECAAAKACECCGETFEPSRPGRRFCSRACYDRRQTKRLTALTCVHCGVKFTASRGRAAQFCSRACSGASVRTCHLKPCEQCGTEFTPRVSTQKFCSHICYSASMRARKGRTCARCAATFEAYPSSRKQFCSVACAKWRERKTYTCAHCGSKFEDRIGSDRTCCSRACHNANQVAKRRKYSRNPNPHAELTIGVKRIRALKTELLAAQGGRCASCDLVVDLSSKHTHLDHDHETGKIRAVLCRSCNSALGALREDPTRAAALSVYAAACQNFRKRSIADQP